jgi:hypothetical protein
MYYNLDIGMMDTQLPGKKAEQPGPDPINVGKIDCSEH